MPVRIEKDGHVTTVIMNRPEVRNAVDHATALALHKAFSEFDADPDAYVGVLCGDNGTFCAGYDLKSVASGQGVGPGRPLRL